MTSAERALLVAVATGVAHLLLRFSENSNYSANLSYTIQKAIDRVAKQAGTPMKEETPTNDPR